MAVTNDDIIYTLPEPPSLISFAEVFGNDLPVELEIGTGKGGFLLEQARAHADRNYLGIEWASQYYRNAVDRMVRWQVPNVRLLRADAKIVVTRCLKDACLAALHVYHPDPWPKRRHHRRRLIDPGFVDAAGRVLQDGAPWNVQTDHAEYFEVILELTDRHPHLERTVAYQHNGEDGGETVATNYQVKYLRGGRTIHHLVLTRLPRT